MDPDYGPPELNKIDVDGKRIAYRLRPGRSPTIVFLSGYMSDMEGAKAQAVDGFARERGLAMLRFDFSGTGSSEGSFQDRTLADWLTECLTIVDQLTVGPLVLVGSSMGGWLALLIALRRIERVRAIVGIAAAPDFTEWGFTPEDRMTLRQQGRIAETDRDGTPARFFTYDFWKSGQQLQVLGSQVQIDCPVRLVHGAADDTVPSTIAERLMQQLRSPDVQLNIVKDGGHRLSAPHEIRAILRVLDDLVELNS